MPRDISEIDFRTFKACEWSFVLGVWDCEVHITNCPYHPPCTSMCASTPCAKLWSGVSDLRLWTMRKAVAYVAWIRSIKLSSWSIPRSKRLRKADDAETSIWTRLFARDVERVSIIINSSIRVISLAIICNPELTSTLNRRTDESLLGSRWGTPLQDGECNQLIMPQIHHHPTNVYASSHWHLSCKPPQKKANCAGISHHATRSESRQTAAHICARLGISFWAETAFHVTKLSCMNSNICCEGSRSSKEAEGFSPLSWTAILGFPSSLCAQVVVLLEYFYLLHLCYNTKYSNWILLTFDDLKTVYTTFLPHRPRQLKCDRNNKHKPNSDNTRSYNITVDTNLFWFHETIWYTSHRVRFHQHRVSSDRCYNGTLVSQCYSCGRNSCSRICNSNGSSDVESLSFERTNHARTIRRRNDCICRSRATGLHERREDEKSIECLGRCAGIWRAIYTASQSSWPTF